MDESTSAQVSGDYGGNLNSLGGSYPTPDYLTKVRPARHTTKDN